VGKGASDWGIQCGRSGRKERSSYAGKREEKPSSRAGESESCGGGRREKLEHITWNGKQTNLYSQSKLSHIQFDAVLFLQNAWKYFQFWDKLSKTDVLMEKVRKGQ
jgi:hypothetical protein